MNQLQKKFVKEVENAKEGDCIFFDEVLGIVKNLGKISPCRGMGHKQISEEGINMKG